MEVKFHLVCNRNQHQKQPVLVNAANVKKWCKKNNQKPVLLPLLTRTDRICPFQDIVQYTTINRPLCAAVTWWPSTGTTWFKRNPPPRQSVALLDPLD